MKGKKKARASLAIGDLITLPWHTWWVRSYSDVDGGYRSVLTEPMAPVIFLGFIKVLKSAFVPPAHAGRLRERYHVVALVQGEVYETDFAYTLDDLRGVVVISRFSRVYYT
jgi:hypothetical protein